MSRAFVYLCAAAWLACVVGSLLALNVEPRGDSFLRGFNRIEGFLTWQFAALGVAVAGVVALRFVPPPRSRLLSALGYGPMALSALLVLALVAVVAWAAFSPPPPVAPADVMPPTVAPSP